MCEINRQWFSGKIKEKNLTQQSVALIMGIHPSTLHRLLTGELRMTIVHLGDLVCILQVSPEDVLKNMGIDLEW